MIRLSYQFDTKGMDITPREQKIIAIILESSELRNSYFSVILTPLSGGRIYS